ncbi:hypothetical protein LEP1GSC070_2236 [Leptospira santarosai str. AIM]|nr:hypothetical protein LEP1GSC070_2236 [Leptospira santarosai str. AIM]
MKSTSILEFHKAFTKAYLAQVRMENSFIRTLKTDFLTAKFDRQMHSYSLDTEIRKVVIVVITIMSMALQSALKNWQSFLNLSESLLMPISFGIIFGLLYFIFDKVIWKYLTTITSVPDLNGEWECIGNSSYKEDDITYEFPLKLIIKQNFSKIEIQAESENSTSKSILAGVFSQHSVGIIRYTFENIPMNMATDELQRHSGFVELRLKNQNLMEGDYFSGKQRLRFGGLKCKRVEGK